jgi:orotate phosphoribosyltransferase
MRPTIQANVYNPTTEQVARALLSSSAYKIRTGVGEDSFFAWKSGIKAPVYNNCRVLFGHPGQRRTVVRSLGSAILAAFPGVNYIIGLAEAGIVWASCVADELGLPVAYVSKTEKKHGIPGRIVGAMPEEPLKNLKAVIVDDLIASGDTLEDAINILSTEKGITPIGIQSIVNWNFKTARERFERLDIPVWALVSYQQMLETALEEGLVTRAAVQELYKFYQNPWDHVWNLAALTSPSDIAEAL